MGRRSGGCTRSIGSIDTGIVIVIVTDTRMESQVGVDMVLGLMALVPVAIAVVVDMATENPL